MDVVWACHVHVHVHMHVHVHVYVHVHVHVHVHVCAMYVHGACICMVSVCACCFMPASEAASFTSLGFMRLAEPKSSVAWLGLGLGFVLSRLASAYECAMRTPCIHHARHTPYRHS